MDGEKIKRKYTPGKLEKNCQTKEERRMGFKKHFLVWKSIGNKEFVEMPYVSWPLA
jgi:hypothetical protein